MGCVFNMYQCLTEGAMMEVDIKRLFIMKCSFYWMEKLYSLLALRY